MLSTITRPIVTPGVPVFHTGNRILRSLPAEDAQRLARQLRPISLRMKQVLMKQGQPIDAVIFPGGGVCSLVRVTEDGHTAEVAPVGGEGMLGLSAFFGQTESPFDVIVQIAGHGGLAMSPDAFETEMRMRGALFNRVVRYNQALMTQIAQTAACNARHSAEERSCRWLLMTHDRVGEDEFPVTHDTLATMLGVRRPTVTQVVARLHGAGFITHRRGSVAILDRDGLARTACECYGAVTSTFNRLLPDFV